MKRLLEPNRFFATPESVDELRAWIDSLSNPEEKHLALTVSMMTWNLASDLAHSELVKVSKEYDVLEANRDYWEDQLMMKLHEGYCDESV